MFLFRKFSFIVISKMISHRMDGYVDRSDSYGGSGGFRPPAPEGVSGEHGNEMGGRDVESCRLYRQLESRLYGDCVLRQDETDGDFLRNVSSPIPSDSVVVSMVSLISGIRLALTADRPLEVPVQHLFSSSLLVDSKKFVFRSGRHASNWISSRQVKPAYSGPAYSGWMFRLHVSSDSLENGDGQRLLGGCTGRLV